MSVATTELVEEQEKRPARIKRTPMSREDREEKWPALPVLADPEPSQRCEDAWVAVFTAHPDVMVRLLQDMIKQAYAVPGRIGQRPMPKEEEVDLHAMLHGDFSDEPLIEVLPKLMRGLSERQFASKVFMSRSQLQRLLKGDYQPDMHELRLIAVAVRKPPAFFMEYRILAAQSAFMRLLADRPGVATKLYRGYLEVQANPKKRN